MTNRLKKRLNLHDALDRWSFDHGFICTYRFDPNFFEEYCLPRLNAISNNGNLTVITDRGTYEKVILGPQADRPKQANLRYLFNPISVSRVFHPKLFIFLSKNRGRLFIGSANFTRPGITSNAELMACYDFEKDKNEIFQPLFKRAILFLNEIADKWKGETLVSNLNTISREIQWLNLDGNYEKDISFIKLIHNLNDPLWHQIIKQVKKPVITVQILSRYFDKDPDILDKLTEDLQPEQIKIFTQNGYTTITENWLKHDFIKNGKAKIYLCNYYDEEYLQPLHAKAISIETKDTTILSFGSANFTTSALFSSSKNGNVEVNLMLKDIDKKDISIKRLFDPEKTAILLKDGDILQSSTNDDTFSATRPEIYLSEAILIEDKIRLNLDISKQLLFDKLKSKIQFQDSNASSLDINPYSDIDNKYFTFISDAILHRLSNTSTIIQVEAFRNNKKVAVSNNILITNLLDIQTGKNVRRERRIKEAQQSIQQFFLVLNDLLADDDEEAFKIFLTFCDIPLTDASRPMFAPRMRTQWDGTKGMRTSGKKNLIIFKRLHELVINFITRHFRKLRQHVEYGGLNSITNFLHIFLASIGILRAQIERGLLGLELNARPISTDDWGNYREMLDLYYIKFEQLLTCLCEEYIPRLRKDYEMNKIKERFAPEIDELNSVFSDMISYRKKLDKLRFSTIEVSNKFGMIISPASYFPHNIFSDDLWVEYERNMKKIFREIKKLAE